MTVAIFAGADGVFGERQVSQNCGCSRNSSTVLDGPTYPTYTLRVRTKFRILKVCTIIPHGARGILRLINSSKLNALLGAFIGPEKLGEIKERAGFGWQMVVLAQKK